jgi:hypothetical protein
VQVDVRDGLAGSVAGIEADWLYPGCRSRWRAAFRSSTRDQRAAPSWRVASK